MSRPILSKSSLKNTHTHLLRGWPVGVAAILGLSLGVFACSDDTNGEDGDGTKGDPSDEGDIDPGLIGGGGENGAGDGDGTPGPYMLPAGYTASEFGGYLLGAEIVDESDLPVPDDDDPEGCGTEIIGIVRDFRRGDRDDGHPDFETYTGNGEPGIVEEQLGSDKKPVHANGDHDFTTSTEDFNQWYRNVEGVNRAYLTSFSFEPNNGILTFESREFFPLDGEGFGNEDHDHNFGFTTEVHTEFKYVGGETFSFIGDDDLWVFINGHLAIDLGGLHPPQDDEVSLDQVADELEIVPGNTYALDLFHAERHSDQSNFRIDTNLQFTNCNIVLDIPVK